MPRAFFFIIILFVAALPAHALVIINEIAWMGTEVSSSDEWIELYSDTEITLNGWTLSTEDGGINLKLKGTTTPQSYFLIERTDDNAVQGIKADIVSSFGKGLSNDGESLLLKDPSGNIVDKVDGSAGWSIGGDNDSKDTLQRNSLSPSGWITAPPTPKAVNAKYIPPKPKAVPTGVVSKEQVKSDDDTKNISEKKLLASADAASSSGEYLWLLGGILGGAFLGLACVIISKWKKSP